MEPERIDEMIASEDSSLRREAAGQLAEIGGAGALDRLEALLKDSNSGVRDAAQNAIVILGGKQAIEKMVRLLTHEDPAIRNMAIDILRKIGIDGVDILHEAAKSMNDNIRLFVLDILGSIGSHESVDTLIEGLYDANPNVRNAAVISLGGIGSPEAFEHLKKLINDEEWIRFSVIEALAHIPHEGVVDFLLEELKRWADDDITASAILETLGGIGSKSSMGPLIDMMKTSNRYVEVSLAETLLRIMSLDDIEGLHPEDREFFKCILESCLPEAEDEFWHAALKALGRIGDSGTARCIVSLSGRIEPDVEPEKWDTIRSALIDLGDRSLMVSLLDADEKSALLASEILSTIGAEEESREIAARIFSAQGYVKRAMTEALALIGGASLREIFLRLIHDDDGHVIALSLKALGGMGNPDDIEALRPFLTHPYPDVKGFALEAMAAIGTVKAEECFTALTKDPDTKMRVMALTGLKMISSERLKDTVSYMLKDQNWEVRMAAAQVVREAVLPIRNDLLMALLNDEHDEIRHHAIDIVGQRKIDEFRSVIEDAVSNDEMWTSFHAIEALGQFRDENAKKRLLEIVKNGPDFLRISAVRTLGRWEDESLIGEIEVYMDDDNLDVARAAAEAIDRLQGVSF